jgi:hypothetical protein
MYNLNYTPTTLGVEVEEKLYQGVREQKRLNTTALGDQVAHTQKTTAKIIVLYI